MGFDRDERGNFAPVKMRGIHIMEGEMSKEGQNKGTYQNIWQSE
jgi:hypothetical protein